MADLKLMKSTIQFFFPCAQSETEHTHKKKRRRREYQSKKKKKEKKKFGTRNGIVCDFWPVSFGYGRSYQQSKIQLAFDIFVYDDLFILSKLKLNFLFVSIELNHSLRNQLKDNFWKKNGYSQLKQFNGEPYLSHVLS